MQQEVLLEVRFVGSATGGSIGSEVFCSLVFLQTLYLIVIVGLY